MALSACSGGKSCRLFASGKKLHIWLGLGLGLGLWRRRERERRLGLGLRLGLRLGSGFGLAGDRPACSIQVW